MFVIDMSKNDITVIRIMGASEWVVRHSKTVILVWIILLALSIPLAASLDKVLKYEETAFLPTNVESVKADEILKEKFGDTVTGGNQVYLLVTNINVSSDEARSAYYELKDRVDGKQAINMTSYYDVLDALVNTSYTIALNATRMASNLTGMLYSAAENMNKTYGDTLKGVAGLVTATNATRNMIRATAEGYLKTIDILNETSAKLLMLRDVLNKTDYAYASIYSSLSTASQELRRLNETLATLNKAAYMIKGAYSKTFFDVTRTYYALATQTSAYTRGTLSPQDIGVVVAWTNTSALGPVAPQLVYAVFNATLPVVASAGPSAVTDELLANLTTMLISSQMSREESGEASFLLTAYSAAFREALRSLDANMGSSTAVIGCYKLMSQDKAYSTIIAPLSDSALHALPAMIEAMGGQVSIPGDGTVPASLLAVMLRTAISLGPTPSPSDLVNATVTIGLQQLQASGSPLASMPGAVDLLKTLLIRGPDKRIALEILTQALQQEAGAEIPPETAKIIVEVVAEHDVNASGVLVRDERELENAVIDASLRLMKEAGAPGAQFSVSPDLLRRLYESNGDPRVISEIAKELVRKGALEMASNITLPENTMLPLGVSIDDFVSRAVDVALSDPEKLASREEELENATITVLRSLMEKNNTMPLPSTISLDELLREAYEIAVEGGSPEPLAKKLFLRGVKEWIDKMTINMTGAPETLVDSVKEAVTEIARSVVSNYPCKSELLLSLVENQALGILEKFIGSDERMKVLADNLDLKTLVSIAVKFKDNPESITRSDVEPIANEILDSMLKYARTYLDMMKSSDNTTIVIVFTPAGSTDHDKYLNALLVRAEAEKLFNKSFPEAKAYVTGDVVSGEELREYGKKDVATVNKVSIIGALIVLFIVVESITATIMPFMSVGTAILLASAIVYILASKVIDISSWARVLMTTTALGLGIDYSTYYLYRFREYLGEGMEHRKAAAEALRRAFDAVTASALAVIIAFASFMIAWDFPFLRVMGIVIPIAVASVFAASLTLVPAIAAEIGGKNWFWWPRKMRVTRAKPRESRVVSTVTKYAPLVVAVALLLGIPATHAFVSFTGSHDISLYLPQGSQTEKAFHLMKEKLGASLTSPTFVVIELKKPLDDSALPVIEEVCKHILGVKGVKVVYSPTRPFGEKLENLSMNEVEMFNGTAYVSSDGKTVMIKVTLEYPAESNEAARTVEEIRSIMKAAASEHSELIEKCYVGGMAAMNLDLDNMINESFWHKILPAAIVLMFVSLLPTLKGLPAAAATMLTIYLGATWSLWVSTTLFHRILGKPMLWFLPMVVLVILMGVGIDYNSFYLVRARDEYERRPPKQALAVAAASANKVVIGLSAILAATYASLVLTKMWAMKEMGLTLVLGIMLTSISAVYLVSPALMALFGEKAWWPWKHGAKKK